MLTQRNYMMWWLVRSFTLVYYDPYTQYAIFLMWWLEGDTGEYNISVVCFLQIFPQDGKVKFSLQTILVMSSFLLVKKEEFK